MTYLLILSLILGSFFNVVAYRVSRGESVVSPPSRCPGCRHRLSAGDLIPVFSFLLLRGRCRYCQCRIAWLYLLGELLMLGGTWAAFWQIGWQWELLVAMVFLSVLVILTLTDLRDMLIPNRIVYPGMIVMLLLRLFVHPLPQGDYIIGALLGGGLFLAVYLFSKGRGMGAGDVRLIALIGLALGWKLILLAIFVASITGSVIGCLFIMFGRISRRSPIPFGPFLALGGWFAYLWGDALVRGYLNLFH